MVELLCSRLLFITAKGYRLRSTIGKGTEGRGQKGSRHKLAMVLSQWSRVGSAYFSPQVGAAICAEYVPNPGSSPGFGVQG